MNKTCIFTSADNSYIPFAAITLLGIRKYNPTVDLYILTSYISKDMKTLLAGYGIGYKEMDLRSIFTQTWDYPIECYYLFAGPELFYEMGYDRSVYVDGDLLCKRDPLDFEFIKDIEGMAGVPGGNSLDIFGGDNAKIQRIWGIDAEVQKNRIRINSGVIYFNNHTMSATRLLDKAGAVFRQAISEDIPRKGDDSLLTLVNLLHFDKSQNLILPAAHNFIPQYHEVHAYPVKDLILFHFGGDGMRKPWNPDAYQSLTPYTPYVYEWRKLAKQHLSKVMYRQFIQQTRLSTSYKLLYVYLIKGMHKFRLYFT